MEDGSIPEFFTHCFLQEDDIVSGCGEEICSETESEVSTAPAVCTTDPIPTECTTYTTPESIPTECTMEPEDG